MKKIMILGASILQLPAIIKAKEMGLQVIAVDMDKNAIGFKEADICLEISTIDIAKVVEAAKKYDIDGILTLASDMPILTIAGVAKELGILGVSKKTAINATNKARMREKLLECGVPIPRFYVINTYKEYLMAINEFATRFIVKPADNSGSRGVFLVTRQDEIKFAYDYSKRYSRSGDIVVEEYMHGNEVSVETLTVDGETHVIAITDKITTGAPNFVEMGHSQPSMIADNVKDKIKEVAVAAVNAIGINNGPSHTEIIITNEGPKIVELGARLGGDCITTHLTPLSTGVNMVECCIKLALGEQPNLIQKFQKASAIRYFKISNGVIKKIENIESAQQIDGIKEITFTRQIGDTANDVNSSNDRIGFVIAQADSPSEAITICEKAISTIVIGVSQ